MKERKFLLAAKGQGVFPPPVWMMRQAGRYLPEYRETRTKAGSFLDLCYNPDFAVEVTLQPIRRFQLDASILFSDILVIPHALGRDLRFEEGRGPILTPLDAKDIPHLKTDAIHEKLEPVYETVRRLRVELPEETALIGFCGAPWTVATYMIAGHGTPDQAPSRVFGYRSPEAMDDLLQKLAESSAEYLIRQIESGVDAVQIFDSWAGVLDQASFDRWCVQPVAEIVRRVKSRFPEIPVIGFPRNAGILYEGYRAATGIDVLGLDWTVPMKQAIALQSQGPIQGNLDPMRLLAGGKALEEGVATILDALGNGPLIFNLGHGITPQTPIAHVEQMLKLIRERG